MAYNGSGTFNLIAGNPVVTGTTISSTWANNTLSDIATGLTTAVCKDGQTTPTANIPLGGFKLTGLDAGTAAGNSVRYEQVALLAGSNMTGGLNSIKTTVASATTPDIFATTVGDIVDYTGTVTCTGFVAAPQAGASRILVCAAAAVFTAGANMLIAGTASGSSFTATAGDEILVIAITTTQFRLVFLRQDGSWAGRQILTGALSGDVLLNNTGAYFDGPTVTQPTYGEWFVFSKCVIISTSVGDAILYKLWDGTTVIDEGRVETGAANARCIIVAGGYINTPAGNLRMTVEDAGSVNGKIRFNDATGASKSSTITAIKI